MVPDCSKNFRGTATLTQMEAGARLAGTGRHGKLGLRVLHAAF
jgi:hypothetical protein